MFRQDSVKRKALLVSLSAVLLGGIVYSYDTFAATDPTPAHVVEKTMRIPDGVVRMETITWGNSSPNVKVVRMSPQQMTAFWRQTMAPFSAMQRQMAEQVALLQRQMQIAFAGSPFGLTPLAFPEQPLFGAPGITVTYVIPGMNGVPLPATAPAIHQPMPKGPVAAPPVPASEMPGSGTYAVAWHHHTSKPQPKVPV